MRRSDKKRLLRAAAAKPLGGAAYGFGGFAPIRADAGDGVAPKWVQYFPKGDHHRFDFPDGHLVIDDAYCAAVVANWEKSGRHELPIDYFHRGDSNSWDGLPVAEKVAAGWISKLEARGDGVWGLTKWTDAARARILADELRYVSPTWLVSGTDPKTGKPQGPTLLGAALLNDPFFKEMPRVAAAAVPPATQTSPESFMNKAAIIALLAKAGAVLDPNITDEAAQAALAKHFDDIASAKTAQAAKDAAILTAKQSAEASEKALKAQLEEAATDKAKMGVRLAALEKAAETAKVDVLVARARTEGRITTAGGLDAVRELAGAVSLAAAEKFVDSFAKGTVVQAGALGHGEKGEGQTVDMKALQAKYDAELDAVLAADKAGVQAASKKVNAKAEYAPLFSKAVINGGSALN